ncbi:MAG: CoA transferase [Alphaproteobacteria bacterium]|nr:CoA transferase [Alphaproteobacteria bacterium]
MSGGPLEGVRVVDLTTVVVGPICTRTLADYGAEVVKVEAPGGDLLRTMAHGSRHPGMSGKFLNFNRNKRSIVLDFKRPDGLAAMRRLIAHADVFVSNVRPEGLARAKLDYASLVTENPRLIHCSILAFGRGGRYYNRPAYDPIVQSLSGVAGTLARATGEPRFVPMVMSDHTSGLIAAQAIGFALFRREKTGRGEAIDVPMLENMASFVSSEHMGAMTFDPPVGPSGDARLLTPDYRPLPTRDGYITVGPNTNAQAFAFFDAIGRPELKTDPRFDNPSSRTANAGAYWEIRKQGLAQKTTDEWLKIFDQLDVPAARYNSIDDLLTDPHLCDVGFFESEDHPSEGRIRRSRPANSFSGGGRDDRLPAPRLGEHTRQVLAELGYGDAEIEAMLKAGAARSAG